MLRSLMLPALVPTHVPDLLGDQVAPLPGAGRHRSTAPHHCTAGAPPRDDDRAPVASEASTQSADIVLDLLPFGIIMLSSVGTVLSHNSQATRILREADGLFLRSTRLAARRTSDDADLASAIGEFMSMGSGLRYGNGRALAIHRSLRRPLGLLLVGCPACPRDSGGNRQPAILAWVSDPDAILRPPVDRLRLLFGLTPAEARLAAALAAGKSVEEYSAEHGISIGTVRWTLKQVFGKTNTRRQPDLVRLLACSVASLGVCA